MNLIIQSDFPFYEQYLQLMTPFLFIFLRVPLLNLLTIQLVYEYLYTFLKYSW